MDGVDVSSGDGVIVIADPVGFPWELPRVEHAVLVVDGRSLSGSELGLSVAADMAHRLRPTDLVVRSRGEQLDRRVASLNAGWVDVPAAMAMAPIADTVRSRLVGRRPQGIGIESAAAVLNTASEVLVDYIIARTGRSPAGTQWTESMFPPLPDGHLMWSGWGGPSGSLLMLGSPPWLRMPGPGPDERPVPIVKMTTAQAIPDDSSDLEASVVIDSPVWGLDTGAVDPVELPGLEAVIGVHTVVDGLMPRRSDRLEWIARLWREIATGGFLAFTFPVEPLPVAGETAKVEAVASAPEPSAAPDHGQLTEEFLEATAGRILTDELVVHRSPADDAMTWATLILRRLGGGTGPDPDR